MTTNDTLIRLTDDRGDFLLPYEELSEPRRGSVVLTDGEFGTAWQRYFSDGRWHSVRGGAPRPWGYLLGKRNLVLVYDAEERGA